MLYSFFCIRDRFLILDAFATAVGTFSPFENRREYDRPHYTTKMNGIDLWQ